MTSRFLHGVSLAVSSSFGVLGSGLLGAVRRYDVSAGAFFNGLRRHFSGHALAVFRSSGAVNVLARLTRRLLLCGVMGSTSVYLATGGFFSILSAVYGTSVAGRFELHSGVPVFGLVDASPITLVGAFGADDWRLEVLNGRYCYSLTGLVVDRVVCGALVSAVALPREVLAAAALVLSSDEYNVVARMDALEALLVR
jgi:hypothetical protein